MSNILKIEAFSGASGDMFLSALAQLTDGYHELVNLPSYLNFEDNAEIVISSVKKNGIACKHVKVNEKIKQHHHRHLTDIFSLIDSSKLTDGAKRIAHDIFSIIGKAESEVHNIPLEKIHFHEVGAVDSIIDICGAAYFLDKLDIEKSYLTDLVTGKGFVNTEHGQLPVPCPATKLIIEDIPYSLGEEKGERLTPTGAAIIKYLNPSIESVSLKDIKTAYGPGEKDFISPNVLRLSLVEPADSNDELIMIETNIDDMNHEYIGIEFQNRLLESGAVDFYFSQILMKKSRPGVKLSVLCTQAKLDDIIDYILNFTSTLGVRYYSVKRKELQRKIEKVETELGIFHVKVSELPNGKKKVKPESYEVLEYAFKNNLEPSKITQIIMDKYESNK